MFKHTCSLVLIIFCIPMLVIAQPNSIKKRVREIGITVYPISTIDPQNDNYSDLIPMLKSIADSRIVMLGEFTHACKEINELKIRIIKFLYEKMDFDVLVFESDFAGMTAMNFQKDTMSEERMIYQGFLSLWHTEEYKDFMKWIALKKPETTGLDPQWLTSGFKNFIRKKPASIDSNMANRLWQLETRYEEFVGLMKKTNVRNSDALKSRRDSLVDNYNMLRDLFSQQKRIHAINKSVIKELDFFIKTFENRISYLMYFTKFKTELPRRFFERNNQMAHNLAWLADTIYPNRKIIVSAHNYHIAYENPEVKVMAQLLPEALKKQAYSIAFFGGEGYYANNSGNPKPIAQLNAGSLRHILLKTNMDQLFLDISREKMNARNKWLFRPIEIEGFATLSGNKFINLKKSFDGIFFIKNISAPVFLFKK